MTSDTTDTAPAKLKTYHSPKTVIGRVIARRTFRSALLWSLIFGAYVASKGIGFVKLYPTAAARQKIAETFGNNLGIELLIGRAPLTATTAAYIAWNTANVMVLFGAIWALLMATKYFRGEEEAGRSEVLLSGQTTARRASLNILSGFSFTLLIFFVVLSLLLAAIGKYHGVGYSTGAAVFFAFLVTLGISLFMMIGALCSQLFATRSRAAGVSASILGIFFLMRAIGDVTSAKWMLNYTPLGWVEKAQPLANVQTIWLIPFLVGLVILTTLTIYFSGRRDLGESIISDKVTTKAHYNLLSSPFRLALRLNRGNIIGWLSGIFITALIYGLITKSTGQIFSKSKPFLHTIHHLAQQAKLTNALAFLGIVFLLQMIIIMAYAASSMAAIRRDEANGYIDNFLVQPFSRYKWLAGRLVIVGGVLALAALLTVLGIWIGIFNQHSGVTFTTLLTASINALVPAVFLVGVTILTFGFYPRLTSIMAYSVLAWSLLIELVGTGLNINHWILDTSLVHQVALAPIVSPNWTINLILVAIAVILSLVGMLRFNYRDIEGE